MKKITAIAIVLMSLFTSSKSAFADAYEDNMGVTWNYSYNSVLDGAVINSVSFYYWLPGMEYPSYDPIGEIRIPSQFPNNNPYVLHYNIPSVKIGYGAFDGCKRLTEVIMPSSMLEIGDYAFRNCTNLTSVSTRYGANGVELHNGVTDIGKYAFSGCSKLAKVLIPDSVINLGVGAFEYCAGLQSVTIGNGVTNIGEFMFDGCVSLTSVTIGNHVATIDQRAFAYCSGLTSMTIPDSVVAIGNYAFDGCNNLRSLIFKGNAPSIGQSCFSGVDSSCIVFVDKNSTGWGVAIPGSWNGLRIKYIPSGCTVTFDANGGSLGLESATRLVYSDSTVGTLPTPIRDGYDFVGWWTEADGGTRISEDTVVTANVTFYAQWKVLCTVAFDANEGSLEAEDSLKTVVSGTDVGTLPVPTRDGYVFAGWWTGVTGGVQISEVTTVTENVTYYAQWIMRTPTMVIEDGVLMGVSDWNDCNTLTIPDSVTSISPVAFRDSADLRSVTLGNSITNIGNYAFDGCVSLTNIIISDSVTSIGYGAFFGCTNLQNCSIRNNVVSIGNEAFYGCSSLTSLTLPNGLMEIGKYMFCNCSSLVNVVIGNSVTNIGEWAFRDCRKLTSVTVPDSVMSIGKWAFYGCGGLTSVTLPFVGSKRGNSDESDALFGYVFGGQYDDDTMISIRQDYSSKDYTFNYIPSSLRAVTITDESIFAYGAFSGCSELTNVTATKSLTCIENRAFSGCNSLMNVMFPDSVMNIGETAFDGTPFLENQPEGLVVLNYFAYKIKWPCPTSIVIPDGVTSIGCWALGGYSSITSVTIPDSMRNIGYAAFGNCSGLTNVTIPEGVMNIGDRAFESCSGLTSVTIPTSVTNVGNYAFRACSRLGEIVFMGNAPAVGSGVFSSAKSTCVIRVVRGSVGWDVDIPGIWNGLRIEYLPCEHEGERSVRGEAEPTCTEAGYTGDIICDICGEVVTSGSSIGSPLGHNMGAGVTTKEPTFMEEGVITYFCTRCGIVMKTESIPKLPPTASTWTLSPDGKTLEAVELNGCTEFVIPDSVTLIQSSVFEDCVGLTSVTLPDGVRYIGDMAFAGCSNLTNVTIPSSVERIGWGAFEGCTSLTDMTIPDSVTYLGGYAFENCTNLQNVTIGNGVYSLDNQFYGCSGLTHVTIGTSVTDIYEAAFYRCNRLRKIVFEGDAPYIESLTFELASVSDCCAYVRRASSGWRVSIPGDWNGIAIDYIHHTLTFNANGGVCDTASLSVADGATIDSIPIPTLPTFDFLGWFTSDDGGAQFNESTVVSEDMTLYAHWKIKQYTIIFNANGGNGGKSVTQDYGTVLPVPTVTRTNYTFIGWSPSVPSTVPASNSTYTAQWKPNQYNITFDANGGIGGTSGELDYGTAIAAPTVTRTGYTFIGWSPAVAATVPASDVTYTAQWKANQYMVTFDANGGVGGTSGQQDYGTSITPPEVTREGYTFAGWSPAVAATVPASDVTHVAQWAINKYTVTFDANGGSGGTSRQQDYGTSIAAPTVTREGYTFVCWSPVVGTTVPASDVTYSAQWKINQYMVMFDANGGTGGTSRQQDYGTAIVAPTVTREGYTFAGWSPTVAATVPASDITYTAQWKINQYTVSFNANGGTFGTDGPTRLVTYETAVGTLPIPTREGYTFDGWWTDEVDGTHVTASSVVKDNVTYHAHWNANSYTVTFNANGGEGSMGDQVFVYDEEQALSPVSFAKNDYRFAGWAQESDGEVLYGDGAVVSNLTAEADGKVTLYAVWEIWTTPMQVCEDAFGGAGVVTLDAAGNIVVTLTNDVSGTVEIPDNVGMVTIDLNGHDIVGDGGGHGVTALPGPAIRIVHGDGDGETTQLAIGDSSDGEKGQIAGGGESAGIEIAEDAAHGVSLDVDEGVAVMNGDGTEQDCSLLGRGSLPWPTDGAYNPLVANVYDGYILDGDGALAGIIQVKAAKQAVKTVTDKVTKVKTATTNVAVTATVTDAAGKKWSYKGDGTVDGVVTGLVCTTKGVLVPSFGVTLGANGLEGEWGDFLVAGARYGMGTKGDAMMAALDANYRKSWSVALTNDQGVTRLQLVVGAKGSTKISGVTPDGFKISATVQGIMGDDAFFVPYLATLKNGKLTRPANLLLTLGEDGAVDARTSDLGGLKSAGPTVDDIEVLPFAESAVSKGGEAYAGAVVLNDLAYPAKFAAKGLPAGLKIDAATGAITGTPTKPGRYTATITVTSGVNSKVKIETKVDFDIGNYTDAAIDVEDSYSGYCVGVMVNEPISAPIDCAVSGLPAGLKFAAKETKDATFGIVAAGTVYGVPTKAGEYTVYFKKTEKVNGKSVNHQASATFKVEGLPAWAQGTFDGHAGRVTLPDGDEGADAQERVPPEGLVTLTVAANGKISGKVIDADGTWTLSAAAFSAVECPASDVEGEADALPVFRATVTGKNGKKAITNEVMVTAEEMAGMRDACPYRGVVSGWAVSEPPVEWAAWQNLWKAEPWKTDAKPFAKVPALAIDVGTRDACPYQGTVTLKFAVSGVVTTSGKFVTGQDARGRDVVYSASCSSVLVPAGAGRPPYRIFLYFPPKAGKFEGYSDEISLVWDGTTFKEE